MTEQTRDQTLRNARRIVAKADSRRLIARLISTKQPISETQLAMTGVEVSLAKIGYYPHPDPSLRYILPVDPPKTEQELLNEVLDILTIYPLKERNMPQWYYQRLRHNLRLIQRMPVQAVMKE